jgi:hypothetical protein
VDGENGGGGALKFSEGASGSATGADERPREGEGCSWCASKGDRREGKRGAAALGGTLLNGTAGVGRGKGAWRREKEGERGLAQRRAGRGGRQRPPATGHRWRRALRTGVPRGADQRAMATMPGGCAG